MKIESIIRRQKGTRVNLDGIQYHFLPTEQDSRHIAEVSREAHIKTLLRIKEGFLALEDVPAEIAKAVEEALKLNGSVVHSAFYDIKGERITLDDLVGMAFEDAGLTHDDWNALSDEDRYRYIDTTLSELQGVQMPPADTPDSEVLVVSEEPGPDGSAEKEDESAPPPTPEAEKVLDRDALAAQYKEKFGKAPHHKLSAERIQQVLEDA